MKRIKVEMPQEFKIDSGLDNDEVVESAIRKYVNSVLKTYDDKVFDFLEQKGFVFTRDAEGVKKLVEQDVTVKSVVKNGEYYFELEVVDK